MANETTDTPVKATVTSIDTSFKDRVVAEKKSVDDNLAKLTAFLATEAFTKLPAAECGRLTRQKNVMNAYASVLGDRLAADFK